MKTKLQSKINLAKNELTLRILQEINDFEPEDESCPSLTKDDVISVLASIIKTKTE